MKALLSEHERSDAYYDRIASEYDAAMASPAARAARDCFWHQVEEHLQPRSRILDFGAGSGLDAEHFAALGHQVTAYDSSDGMLGRLRERCRAEIATGQVLPITGTLDGLRARLSTEPAFDQIICNFAVFSMIADPRPVLACLAEVAGPGARVLISIQNPWCGRDMRSAAFLKAVLAYPRYGVLRYRSGDTGVLYRYTRGQLERAAGPEFVAVRPDTWRPCCRRSFGRFSTFTLVGLRRV
jgi:SAM-dependent methyltransferase